MIFRNILKLKGMNRYRRVIITGFLLFLYFPVFGQEYWKLAKEKDSIKVFTRDNTVSTFKEFKAIMNIDASVDQLLAVLYDIEALPDWAYSVEKSRLIDRPNDAEQIYYAVASVPWPYKDRDGVYRNHIEWNKETSILTVQIEMLEKEIEMNDDYVRMDGYGFWQFKKISESESAVVFQMQVDPGGKIKPWMANMFVTDSPYQTLLGLREIIKQKKYKDKKYKILND